MGITFDRVKSVATALQGREKKPDIAAIRLNRFLFDYAIVDIVYQRYGEDQGQLLESSRHGYKLRSKIMKEQA